MIDVVEVLQHWHAGRSKSQVAASLGVDRGTIRKYIAPAEAAGLAPGGPPLSREEWAELVRGWFPELVDAKARSSTYPEINGHRDRIAEMLKTNTVTTVWQRLRDEHGLVAGISSFRRYVWMEFPGQNIGERVTVLRPPVPPGEEAQIAFGYLGSWLDPVTEKVRRLWAFVMVLAASRHMFVRPVPSMTAPVWVACHVAAFEFFGGYAGDRCQEASWARRSRRPSKIFCRPTWPLASASSRWRSRVGLNSIVVTKNEQDSQIDSKWQSISTGRAQ